MDEHETDLSPGGSDRRAFLRRMVAAGFALPAVAAVESVFAADAGAEKACHEHPHGHGPGNGHGHGHEDCTTTTAAPSTTAAPTTTAAATTTAAPVTTIAPATTTTVSAP
jgi:hypothetical protein